MAKQIKSNPKNDFDFSKISNVIDGLSKKSMITIDNLKGEKSYISTGIYILNALISKSIKKGGVPKNRITIFAGPPQTGKSYIALNIVRNAQKEDYNVFYIDTEFSIENTDFDMFGINIENENKFKLIRSNKVENLKIAVVQILDALKEQKEKGVDVSKTLFILDSIGQLASVKEVEDAMEGKHKQDMSRAKAIKSLFRVITNDLGYLNIPLVATNHIYMCLSKTQEIIKSNGNFEQIQNINVGDLIKTLDGNKEVLEKYEYENCPIIKLTLENDNIIKCTPNHKFLIKSDWNNDENDECWKTAEDLNEDDIILSVMMDG